MNESPKVVERISGKSSARSQVSWLLSSALGLGARCLSLKSQPDIQSLGFQARPRQNRLFFIPLFIYQSGQFGKSLKCLLLNGPKWVKVLLFFHYVKVFLGLSTYVDMEPKEAKVLFLFL